MTKVSPQDLNICHGISYTLFPEHNMLTASVVGEVSFEDMVNYLKALSANRLYKPGMNSLYDLTLCRDIQGNLTDLSTFTRILSEASESMPVCKTALILPTDNDKLLQMVKGMVMMTSRSNIEHCYFLANQRNVIQAFLDCPTHFMPSIETTVHPPVLVP